MSERWKIRAIQEALDSREWYLPSHYNYDGLLTRIKEIVYSDEPQNTSCPSGAPFTADDAHHGLTGE